MYRALNGNPLLPQKGQRDPLGETLRQVVEEIKRDGRYRDPTQLREGRLQIDLAFGEPLSRADQEWLFSKRTKRRGAPPRYHAWAVRALVDLARQWWAPSRAVAKEHVAAFLCLSFDTVERLDKLKRSPPPPDPCAFELVRLPPRH